MVLRSAAQLRVAGGEVRGDSLEFVLVGCNLNDYDLTGDSIRTILSLAGREVSAGTTIRPMLFASRDTSRLTLTIPAQGLADAVQGEPQPFELTVVSSLRTPLGERDLTYRLTGDVRAMGNEFAWRVPENRGCRPGGSQLPDYFDRRIPLDRRSE